MKIKLLACALMINYSGISLASQSVSVQEVLMLGCALTLAKVQQEVPGSHSRLEQRTCVVDHEQRVRALQDSFSNRSDKNTSFTARNQRNNPIHQPKK